MAKDTGRPRTPDTWWNASKTDVAKRVDGLVNVLWELDADRRLRVEDSMRRYSGRNFRGTTPFDYGVGRTGVPMPQLRWNVIKAAIDTIVAKVGKNRPRPTFLTNGGDWSLQQRAKKLQQFIDGVFGQARVYEVTPLGFRDAMLAGTGAWYFYTEQGRPKVERVFPLELLVDPVEAINGDPLSLYRVRYVAPERLAALYPDKAAKILALDTVTSDSKDEAGGPEAASPGGHSPRLLKVVEAWHLKLSDAEDGRYVACVGDLALADCCWEHDYFPFEFMHWAAPLRGFWGDSAVDEVKGLSDSANRLMQMAERAMALCSNPWVLVPKDSGLNFSKLTDEPGIKVEYEGTQAPTVESHQAVHPQVFEQIESFGMKVFTTLGSNELAASATKPPGVESGRALEQLSEEHLVRFETVSRHFENLVGNRFARQFIRLAKALDEELPGGYRLKAVKNRTLLDIKWADVAISPDDFFIEVFPTSVLPHLPAAKTAEVERWQANQWIDQPTAMRLLDFPDLKSEQNILTADAELLCSQLEAMLERGEAVEPDPHQNIQRALQYGQLAYLNSAFDGTPEKHRERLEAFLNVAAEMVQAAQQPPTPAGVPAAGAVPVTPQTPPV